MNDNFDKMDKDLYSKTGFDKNDLREVKNRSAAFSDPTAVEAIRNIMAEEKEREKVSKLVAIVFNLCNLCGYYVEGRLALRNKTTGKVWK